MHLTLLMLVVYKTRVITKLVNMTYARHESPGCSVVRAFNGVTEGHGFDSCRGLRFFSFSYALDNLNIPSFLEKKNSANRKYRSID